jgi:intracellular sulfur oxidation DsrE/DsrF family protein
MTHEDSGRRSLLVGMSAAAAGFVAGATTACAQGPATTDQGGGFVPERHEFDAWLDELPGGHRVFVDSATAGGGAEALLYANNLYDAQEMAYSGNSADFAMIVCFRHLSTPFAYNDSMWLRHGTVFHGLMNFADPETGEAPTYNLMNSADHSTLANFGNTIDSLAARGAQFAVCAVATQFFARQIGAAEASSAIDVYEELAAGMIPNSRLVSAGVMAVTRAQEYGYSLLYSG